MKLFRRRLTHIRQPSESTMTLCGRKVLGPPKVGRPVCWECTDRMLKIMGSWSPRYVWTKVHSWKEE